MTRCWATIALTFFFLVSVSFKEFVYYIAFSLLCIHGSRAAFCLAANSSPPRSHRWNPARGPPQRAVACFLFLLFLSALLHLSLTIDSFPRARRPLLVQRVRGQLWRWRVVTDRQKDRQTDRKIDRHTDTRADQPTESKRKREREREGTSHADSLKDTKAA